MIFEIIVVLLLGKIYSYLNKQVSKECKSYCREKKNNKDLNNDFIKYSNLLGAEAEAGLNKKIIH